MKFLLLISLIAVTPQSNVYAVEFSEPRCAAVAGAQLVSDCLDKTLREEDRHLNSIYALIMRMLDAGAVDPASAFFYNKKKDLIAAERAWFKYRDAQCGAEATMIGRASASGVVTVTFDCLSKMAKERIVYLSRVASSLSFESRLCRANADACRIAEVELPR